MICNPYFRVGSKDFSSSKNSIQSDFVTFRGPAITMQKHVNVINIWQAFVREETQLLGLHKLNSKI